MAEEVNELKKTYTELQALNKSQSELIQKLTVEICELKWSTGSVYNAVIENGATITHRFRSSNDQLAEIQRRRAEALERQRIEYQKRVGQDRYLAECTELSEHTRDADGFDEVDRFDDLECDCGCNYKKP
jgi:hypothetical protein